MVKDKPKSVAGKVREGLGHFNFKKKVTTHNIKTNKIGLFGVGKY